MSLEQWYRHGRGQYSLPVSQTFVIAARAAYERCWISSKIPRDPCRNGDIWQCRRTKAPRNFPRPIRFNAIETQRNFGRTELVAGSSPTPRSYWSGNNKIGGLSSSRFESESKIVRASRAIRTREKSWCMAADLNARMSTQMREKVKIRGEMWPWWLEVNISRKLLLSIHLMNSVLKIVDGNMQHYQIAEFTQSRAEIQNKISFFIRFQRFFKDWACNLQGFSEELRNLTY